MALPLESVVKQLNDSGIVSAGKLENFVPPKAHPKDADELIAALVKENHLTKFQAAQFAAGRAKALILGGYTIVDRIGAGGMGQVFKAEHRRMKRVVAIKTLPAGTMKDPAAVARFQREVEAAAKLRHTNIVAADDADEAGGVHFLVMEFVDGQDLSSLVKKNGLLPMEKALDYVRQAACGLAYAHGEGVIHRDIKPGNLLVDKKGTVKILDMGLARIDGGGDVAGQAELTGTGAVMGTVDYMAPEQAMSTKHADARADVYSLGCTLHYLLTGRPPFTGDTLMARLVAHREAPIPSLRTELPTLPDEIDRIFQKLLAKRVDDRYQSMTELIVDLEPLVGVQSEASRERQRPEAGIDSGLVTFLKDLPAQTTKKAVSPPVATPAKPQATGKTKLNPLLIVVGTIACAVLVVGSWYLFPSQGEPGASATGGPTTTAPAVAVVPQAKPAQTKPPGANASGSPKTVAPIAPPPSFLDVATPTLRWPLAPSKPEVVRALLNMKAELLVRAGPNSETKITTHAEIPKGATTVVGVTMSSSEVPADDTILAFLAGLTDLEELVFTGPTKHNVTSGGMSKLAALVHLRRLGMNTLGNETIGATDILKSMPQLEYLYVPSGVADEWCRAVAKCPKVVEIKAYRRNMTDEGLAYLEKMPQLKSLLITENPAITAAAVQRFAAAVPGCRIEWGPNAAKKIIPTRTTPPGSTALPDAKTGSPASSRFDLFTSPDYEWSEPEKVELGTAAADFEATPFVSIDGLTLLLSKPQDGHGDLFECRRPTRDAPWSTPVNLGPNVNSPLNDEGPALSPDGLTLYFSSYRAENKFYLYTSTRVTLTAPWEPATRMPASFDAAGEQQGGPEPSRDGMSLLFCALNKASTNGFELWIARRPTTTSAWGPPENLGPAINGTRSNNNRDPALSPDGRVLAYLRYYSFESRRELWWSSRPSLDAPWSPAKPFGPPLNARFYTGPAFADDATLLFSAADSANSAEKKLYSSRRVPKQKASLTPYKLFTSPDYEWTEPENLGPVVNSPEDDGGPSLSADGLGLFFHSKRSGGQAFEDIWMCRRSTLDAPWSPPEVLSPKVNSGASDQFPSLSADGLTLYFASDRGSNPREFHLWSSSRPTTADDWLPAQRIESLFVEGGHDAGPRISADGLVLLFHSPTRPGFSKQDLWQSRRKNLTDAWGPPENLGPSINSNQDEFQATFSSDGRVLIFTSGVNGYLYWSSRPTVDSPWSVPQSFDAPIKTSNKLSSPTLSADGATIIVAAFDRPGGHGKTDLWMTRRVPKANSGK